MGVFVCVCVCVCVEGGVREGMCVCVRCVMWMHGHAEKCLCQFFKAYMHVVTLLVSKQAVQYFLYNPGKHYCCTDNHISNQISAIGDIKKCTCR